MTTFGAWLRAVRLSAPGRPSQDTLGMRCREREPGCAIHQARMTSWECGKDIPTPRQLGLMAVELSLTAGQLAEGERLLAAAAYAGLPLPAPDHGSPLVAAPPEEEATAT